MLYQPSLPHRVACIGKNRKSEYSLKLLNEMQDINSNKYKPKKKEIWHYRIQNPMRRSVQKSTETLVLLF